MKTAMRIVFLCLLSLCLMGASQNALRNPIANPNAKKGGSITLFYGAFPKSFNYYLDNNAFTALVFYLMHNTLITSHPLDLSPIPGIAKSWEISPDKKVFTFYLDPEARWSDGKPITAHDVLFTYDVLMNPKNLTSIMRIGLSRFEKPKIIDDHTVRFTAKTVHWENFRYFTGFAVLPKHILEGRDFNKQNFEFPVVSGPYKIKELKKGRYIELARRKDWWAKDDPMNIGQYNFDMLRFKTIRERLAAFELFKKGGIDFFPVYTAKRWHTETDSEKFQKNWIVKQRAYNFNPPGFQGFAMNIRRPLFSDVRVRKALAHLINRKLMNEKLMYNEYFMLNSYFTDIYLSLEAIPNKLIEYDLDKARALLKEASWTDTDSEGYLVKDGQRFEFTILMRNQSVEKFFTIYLEDLKKVGIKANLQLVSMSTWFKKMGEYKFDMTWSAWSVPTLKNPESMWHSKQADEPAGNNITGFKNPEVDRLIEEQKTIFDVNKRHEICKQIDKILFREHPYALLWAINNTRLLYWNKFGKPKTVLDKYSNESAAITYWWYDAEKDKRLKEAMSKGKALPPEPAEVHFSDFFK